MRVNVGAGPHYAKGWCNVDVVDRPDVGITPDVVASITDLPFEDGEVSHLYAGHCLEHLAIQDGPPSTLDRALREVRRVLAPDGIAAFVGPDVYRALQWWKDGRADWDLVDACLEGPDSGVGVPLEGDEGWVGLYHAWNQNETRLLGFVRDVFPDAEAVSMQSPTLDVFPLVSRVEWQCAIITRPPT